MWGVALIWTATPPITVTRSGSRGVCPARSSNAHLVVLTGSQPRRGEQMSGKTKGVIIGVDPHKMSVTIEVVDTHERLLGSGRFDTTNAGYAAMQRYVKQWPDRVWAVEGAGGAGRPLAQRLVAADEQVVDVPAKLAARGTALRHRSQPQDRRPGRPLHRGRCGPHRRPSGGGRGR